MLPAVAVVLAISVVVGAINGAIIAGLRVNPLIATLGVGLVLQGLLSASFTDFAGSVPQAFQAFAYGAPRSGPVLRARPVRARARRVVDAGGDAVRRSPLRRRRQRRRGAARWRPHPFRHGGGRT